MPMPNCQFCGSTAHYKTFCLKNPSRQLITKRAKPIAKWGKHASFWAEFRKKYLAAHPPNDEGYYICYICGVWMLPEVTTLDHIIPRSGAPSLRYNEENIGVCCGTCNGSKGSQSLENYLSKIKA